jgi:hypothetical protein
VCQKKFETYAKAGNIFDQISNSRYLISYNPAALHNQVIFTIGKLLFWTLIHNGFWPYWLDPLHFQSIFEIYIDTKSLCLEINPIVGRVIDNLENIDDYTIDKAHLEEPYFKEFLLNNELQVNLFIVITYLFFFKELLLTTV